MSNQQYLSELVDYYTKHKCINQKQEIVASPSFLPFYKNKPEEQILYEYLKDKRGSADKLNETSSVSFSLNDRSISEIRNREQANSSFQNTRFLTQEIDQRSGTAETKRPDYGDSRANRDSGKISSQDIRESPTERMPSNPRLNPREEEREQLLPKEDPKPKKTSNLIERLNAKKQEMKQPKPEEVRGGEDLSPNPSNKAQFSKQEEFAGASRNEEPESVQEPVPIRRGFMSIVKENQGQNPRSQEQPVKPKEEDLSSSKVGYQPLSNQDSGYRESPLRQDRAERKREEQDEFEQESRANRGYGARGNRESESPSIATREEESYSRSKQEGPRIVKLSGSQRESNETHQNQKEQSSSERFRAQEMYGSNDAMNERENSNIRSSSRLQVKDEEQESLLHRREDSNYRESNIASKPEVQKKKFTLEKEPEEFEEENEHMHRRLESSYRELSATSKPEVQKKKFTLEKEPEEPEEEYQPAVRVDNSRIGSKGDSMRQSQTSAQSRNRETVEKDYDEPEYQPSVRYREDTQERSQIKFKNDNRGEFGKGNPYKDREYSNEDVKMSESRFVSQRDQGYDDNRSAGLRASQQGFASEKPMRSETSIAESTEKKASERMEKAGGRSVANYLKSIEEMLMKMLVKQEALEENQRKILQAQKRQEEAIEDLRLQMTGE